MIIIVIAAIRTAHITKGNQQYTKKNDFMGCCF
jgi:hypothetical protein